MSRYFRTYCLHNDLSAIFLAKNTAKCKILTLKKYMRIHNMTRGVNFNHIILPLSLNEILDPDSIVTKESLGTISASVEKKGKHLTDSQVNAIKTTLAEIYGIKNRSDFKPYKVLLAASQNNHHFFAEKIIKVYSHTFNLREKLKVLFAATPDGTRQSIYFSMINASLDANTSIIKNAAGYITAGLVFGLVFPVYQLLLLPYVFGTTIWNAKKLYNNHSEKSLVDAYASKQVPCGISSPDDIPDVDQELEVIRLAKEAGKSWTGYFHSFRHAQALKPTNWTLFTAAKECQMKDEATLDKVIKRLEGIKALKTKMKNT